MGVSAKQLQYVKAKQFFSVAFCNNKIFKKYAGFLQHGMSLVTQKKAITLINNGQIEATFIENSRVSGLIPLKATRLKRLISYGWPFLFV
jgi:hypothetical protein